MDEPTVAARLDAILAKLAPQAVKAHATTGKWPLPDGEKHDSKRTAPYTVLTLRDGRRRVIVMADDGDVVAGVGKTTADAVAAIEAKIGK